MTNVRLRMCPFCGAPDIPADIDIAAGRMTVWHACPAKLPAEVEISFNAADPDAKYDFELTADGLKPLEGTEPTQAEPQPQSDAGSS